MSLYRWSPPGTGTILVGGCEHGPGDIIDISDDVAVQVRDVHRCHGILVPIADPDPDAPVVPVMPTPIVAPPVAETPALIRTVPKPVPVVAQGIAAATDPLWLAYIGLHHTTRRRIAQQIDPQFAGRTTDADAVVLATIKDDRAKIAAILGARS